MRAKINLTKFTFIWLVLCILAIFSASSLLALPYGAGSYGTCTFDTCGISITSSGTVSLGVIPAAGGVYTTASDSVNVTTGSSTGYTLRLSDTDTNTSLASGLNTIPASSGIPVSPVNLPINSWGYRVDGQHGFDAGPTVAQSNVSSSSYVFAGVPASNQTSHIIKTTSVAADPSDTTLVWYGVYIDTSKPNGTYSNQVVYTAVTNN